MQKITPCLWFDDKADEAAKFYTFIFKNSKIGDVTYYGKEGYEIHGREEGSVLTAEFEIERHKFVAQWWTDIQIQRSHLIPGPLQYSRRSGLLLGEAL